MAEELVWQNLRLTPEDHPRKEMHLVLLSQYLEAQHRAYLSLTVVRSQSDGRGWLDCVLSLPDRLLSVSHTLLYGILTLTLGGRDYDHPLYNRKKKKHCGEVNVMLRVQMTELGFWFIYLQILGAESTPPTAPDVR